MTARLLPLVDLPTGCVPNMVSVVAIAAIKCHVFLLRKNLCDNNNKWYIDVYSAISMELTNRISAEMIGIYRECGDEPPIICRMTACPAYGCLYISHTSSASPAPSSTIHRARVNSDGSIAAGNNQWSVLSTCVSLSVSSQRTLIVLCTKKIRANTERHITEYTSYGILIRKVVIEYDAEPQLLNDAIQLPDGKFAVAVTSSLQGVVILSKDGRPLKNYAECIDPSAGDAAVHNICGNVTRMRIASRRSSQQILVRCDRQLLTIDQSKVFASVADTRAIEDTKTTQLVDIFADDIDGRDTLYVAEFMPGEGDRVVIIERLTGLCQA